jgi:hypothetical protein
MALFKRKPKPVARDHTPGEVRYNPEWRKANQPPARKPHPTLLPKPLTRQLKRQADRRANKQPLGMSQEKWHRLMGLGKVAPFGSSSRSRRRAA